MRPTGMPVQSPTTAATACSSTLGMISGCSPWSCASFRSRPLSSASAPSRSPVEQRRRGSALGHRHRGGGRRRLPAGLPVPSTGAVAPRSFERSSRMRSTRSFSSFQRDSSPVRRCFSTSTFSRRVGLAGAGLEPAGLLARDDLELGLERLDPAARVLDLGGDGVLADRDARAGGVEQAHRLVGSWRAECSDARAAPRPRSPGRGAGRDGATRACSPRRAS